MTLQAADQGDGTALGEVAPRLLAIANTGARSDLRALAEFMKEASAMDGSWHRDPLAV